VIPKFHGAKLTDMPDEDLLEILVRGNPSDEGGEERLQGMNMDLKLGSSPIAEPPRSLNVRNC
jgi:hypothetical protein